MTTEGSSLEVRVWIAARPETVFGFFTDPASFAEWMGAVHGQAEIEPKVGGALSVTFPGAKKVVRGEVTALDAPHRFGFTWGFEDSIPFGVGSTEVAITLTPERGGTAVVLAQSGLPSDAAARDHRGGWRLYASVLAARAGDREHGARVPELVAAWFDAWNETDAAKRAMHLGACMEDGGDFRHAYAAVTGLDDLSGHITASQGMMRGLRLEGGHVEQCHEFVRYAWRLLAPDGSTVATGTNVGVLGPTGRFARVAGFTDPERDTRN